MMRLEAGLGLHQILMEVDFRFQLFMDSNPLGSTKLDLHGLTTQEAVERLEWWLEAKRKVGIGNLLKNLGNQHAMI